MGCHCSIHNDTQDETVMVYIGVNTKVVQPILWSITGLATIASSGVAIGMVPEILSLSLGSSARVTNLAITVASMTSVANGVVSASNFLLDNLQTKLIQDLTKGGYQKLLVGQTYTTTSKYLPPNWNLRAWVIRIQKTKTALLIRRCDASIWTGRTPNSHVLYNVMDKGKFRSWNCYPQETIPIQYQYHLPKEIGTIQLEESTEASKTQSTTTAEKTKATNEATADFNTATNAASNIASISINTKWGKGDLNHQDDDQDNDSFTVLDSGIAKCRCTIVETIQNDASGARDNNQMDSRNKDIVQDGSESWIQVDAMMNSNVVG